MAQTIAQTEDNLRYAVDDLLYFCSNCGLNPTLLAAKIDAVVEATEANEGRRTPVGHLADPGTIDDLNRVLRSNAFSDLDGSNDGQSDTVVRKITEALMPMALRALGSEYILGLMRTPRRSHEPDRARFRTTTRGGRSSRKRRATRKR